MGAVSVNGFRGLRIENLEVRIGQNPGATATIRSPITLIHINLNDLLYGDLRVERIELNRSKIHLEGPPSADWLEPNGDIVPAPDFETTPSFRITGSDAELTLTDPRTRKQIDITQFAFDVTRLTDSDQLNADLSGLLHDDADKPLTVKLSATDPDDFDLRIYVENLRPDDVELVLPGTENVVLSGSMRPTVWVNGRPGDSVVISVHAPFDDLELRDQPNFLEPADGVLTALAEYDIQSQQLTLHNAHADSTAVTGDLDGTIGFDQKYPELDLTLIASRIPTRNILNDIFENADENRGTFEFVFDGEEAIKLLMRGTTDHPEFLAIVSSPRGSVEFIPQDEGLPLIALELQTIEARWDPDREAPLELSCSITDGVVEHKDSGVRLTDVFGALNVSEGIVTLDPARAVFHDNPVVATARYDVDSQDGHATFNGTVAELEKTKLYDSIPKTVVSGAAAVDGKLTKTGDEYTVDAEVDLTQTQIDYQWWFAKPLGIGAQVQVHSVLAFDRGADLSLEGTVASSRLSATVQLGRTEFTPSGWQLETLNARSNQLDVNAVAKCLRLPYTISGTTASNGFFNWTRTGPGRSWDQHGGLVAETVELTAKVPEVEGPVELHETVIEVEMSAAEGSDAHLSASAERASIPAVGGNWLVPLRPPPGYEQRDRVWTFDLAAAHMEAPPWTGRQFVASAYTNPATTGFDEYSSKVGDGFLKGKYNLNKETNQLESEVRWQNIPATIMLEHLGYEPILEGAMTGDVSYRMDRDDPQTLEGTGSLDIRDGKFSADYLYSLLRSQSDDEFVTLPPNLAFNRVQADVDFAGDRVETPKLILDSPAFYIDGKGHFIRDGDLDYLITVAVDPLTAQEIPMLADNFNLDGIQLSQQKLNLVFRISGPTFGPTGQLAQLPPASVTLVSGALQVANEAAKVVDLPRRVLVGLLKTGGGIVGP